MNKLGCFGLSMMTGLIAGCGPAGGDQWEESLGTLEEAVAGTATFGETAVAPVSVTNGVKTPIAFNSNDLRVRAIAIMDRDVYVGGTFSFFVGQQKYTNLVRFVVPSLSSSPLELDQSFHPSIDKPVWAIALTPFLATKIYVGGEFTTIDSTARAGLAALNKVGGSLDTAFRADIDWATGSCTANCGSEPPQNAAQGVHALAIDTGQLIVGGNFTKIKGVSRSGLAAVDTATGAVSTTAFTTGVSGFVSALRVVPPSTVYVGGYYSVTSGGVSHSGLMATNYTGTIQSTVFSAANVIALDYDTANSRVLAGTSANALRSFSTSGTLRWSASTQGDVQAVHAYDGNVYFGFHDGLFVDGNANGAAGDQYKLAAVNASDGTRLRDKVHAGSCVAATPDNCWAPDNDSAGKSFSAGSGGWGLWAITHYADQGGFKRLVVGGEVNKWGTGGTVDSKLLTTFAP